MDRCLRAVMRVVLFRNKYKVANSVFQYLKILPINLNVKVQQVKFMKKLV